ncbi:MAG: metalloregulator ArsR/SmtB family transcription factor [Candidatus Omnitrophica bacterium]|nr:metalloregulator ArsR/SmtB family transcription factor [Candidatus Omnitrophota bacterium]
MKLKDSQKVFAALADETRLRILSLLNEGELCVCDLIRVLNEPQSKISRHLAYLRKSGLVAGRKEGLWMHYRLSKPTTKLYGMLIRAVCCCRSEFDEFGKDLQVLNKNKACLVGSLKCC